MVVGAEVAVVGSSRFVEVETADDVAAAEAIAVAVAAARMSLSAIVAETS